MIPLDPDRAKELAESMDQLDDELQALFDGFEQQVKLHALRQARV